MDIYVLESTMKRILRNFKASRFPNLLFESKDRIVTQIHGLTIMAPKRKQDKLYKDAYPFTRYGYSSISTSETEPISRTDLLEDAKTILNQLTKEEIDQLLETIRYNH